MSADVLRIGCGAGFAADRLDAAVELVERGRLDWLVLECLGERTLAFAHRDRRADPARGYNPWLERRMRALLPLCRERGTRLLSNMGAANPRAAGEATVRIARALGLGGLRAHLSERFAVPQLMVMNPGSLADWPLREQRALFRLLGDVEAAVGVTLTPSLLMTPTKSVSGIFFPSEETFASCQLCPREACPNRRAPYDPELFAKKYARMETP